jgi:hypothetical protein
MDIGWCYVDKGRKIKVINNDKISSLTQMIYSPYFQYLEIRNTMFNVLITLSCSR